MEEGGEGVEEGGEGGEGAGAARRASVCAVVQRDPPAKLAATLPATQPA